MADKEALRLADALDARVVPRWVHGTGQTPKQSGYKKDAECEQAAACLRRQHAEIESLKAERDEDRRREYGYSQQVVDALTNERDALRAERDVLLDLLGKCYNVISTIEPEDSDKAEQLRAVLDAIDLAIEPDRHKGALL